MHPGRSGIGESLRRLASSGIGILQSRLELLSVELQEEGLRLRSLVAFGTAALFFLGFGVVLLSVFFTVLLWDSHRLLALGVASGVFLGAGAVCALVAAAIARGGSKLFAASLSELARDRDALERPR